jgi:hypothetical protein
VALDAQQIAAMAGRPAEALTRRDVARALLAADSAEALATLPDLRRQLISAGNPLSAVFWDTADAALQKIADGSATVGDVQNWLETTGTEPASMLGMLIWDEPDERSPLQAEIYQLLVVHLEELLAAGRIDPDELALAGLDALQRHRRLQEEWMMAPLPDGRIPMWTLLDESDEEMQAEWDAAEAEALAELRSVLAELPARPVPDDDLHAACDRIRATMLQPGWPKTLLVACGGVDPDDLPADDEQLWLTLASGIVSPREELGPAVDAEDDDLEDDDEDLEDEDDDEDLEDLEDEDDEDLFDTDLGDTDLTADESSMVALCALDHYDWLAATTALARGGPGTSASPAALARYVGEYDPDDYDDQADATAEMFSSAVGLWEVMGAIDDGERLTPLGWWGLPNAVQRAWEPRPDQ